ncbi:MAG TPA: glycosyltransferase family 2 protein [Rhodothermales bacterium]|nr:glycosyltransferase family 2 protein [Rhodothermales bacterium]
MPVRNEAQYIRQSLGAVLAQDYPQDRLEVIVADGMSEDATRVYVHALADGTVPITLLDNPAGIVPTALNQALQYAKGEVIVRVDGHCEIASDYLHCCIETLRNTRAECVGGSIETVGETFVAQAIALAQSAPFGVGGVAFRIGKQEGAFVDTVAFGAYRREVFEKIGLFDEELVRNQDDEFNFRLRQAGGTIWMDPSIRSIYYSRASFRKLWRQYFQYGYFKVRVIQKRGAIPSGRHLVPGLFVLGILATIGIALFTGNWLWGLVVAGPYLATNLSVSLWTARKDIRTLPLLPLAFLILHLSYGIGFLWGLWRWRHTWRNNVHAQSIEALTDKLKTQNPPS